MKCASSKCDDLAALDECDGSPTYQSGLCAECERGRLEEKARWAREAPADVALEDGVVRLSFGVRVF